MSERLSRVHGQHLVAWAKDKPDVLLLSADLTSSCEADGFARAYPDRFVSLGVAEQHMLSFAGGLAREGFTPLVHTFAVFLYRRAYDQLAMSIAYPALPVKLFGFLPGLTTPGGATHQAIEDIAVLSALPNLTILECADATDAASALDVAYDRPGPVYVRMLRGELPRLFAEPMRLGTCRVSHEDADPDVLIVSSGVCVEEAMRAVPLLRQHGVRLIHAHVSTLKPFPAQTIVEWASRTRHGVISMENHSVIGGLGSRIAEALAEAGLGKPLTRMGLRDTFAHGGSTPYLMATYGLDAMALVRAVQTRLGQTLAITPEQLLTVTPGPELITAKAEAL